MFDSAFWIGAAMALALALGLGQKHPIARIGLWSLAAFWPSFGPRATSRAGMGRLASRGLPPSWWSNISERVGRWQGQDGRWCGRPIAKRAGGRILIIVLAPALDQIPGLSQ